MKSNLKIHNDVEKKINITKSAILGVGAELVYIFGKSSKFLNKKFYFYILENCITIPVWYLILLASLPLVPIIIDKTIYSPKKGNKTANSEIINVLDKIHECKEKSNNVDDMEELNSKLQSCLKLNGGSSNEI